MRGFIALHLRILAYHPWLMNNNFPFIFPIPIHSVLFFPPLPLFSPLFLPAREGLTSTASFYFLWAPFSALHYNGESATVPRLIALELACRSSPHRSLCLLSKELKTALCCAVAFQWLLKVCHKSVSTLCTCSMAFCSLPGIKYQVVPL